MIRVYIASPYTNGDKEENVNLQIDVANELLNRDFAPYVPTLAHFIEARHPRKEYDWLKLDFEYLALCHFVIRIRPFKNGKEIISPGADKEEEYAKKLGIPVHTFNTIEDVCKYLDEHFYNV